MRIITRKMTLAQFEKKHGKLSNFGEMNVEEDGHKTCKFNVNTGLNYYPDTQMVCLITVK